MTSNEPVELEADELDYFDSLDIDSAPVDPYKHALGTFEFELTEVELARGKEKPDGTRPLGAVWHWNSDEGEVTKWLNFPSPNGKNPQKQLSFTRAYLSSIGIPDEDHSKVLKQIFKFQDDSDVRGLKITATVVNDGDFQKLEKIQPNVSGVRGEATASVGSKGASDDMFD